MFQSKRSSSAIGRLLLLVTSTIAVAQSQRPEVSASRIANAASYAPGGSVVEHSISVIFGRNLARGTVSASSDPLPRTLGGTTVRIAGIAAPLLFVSPTQINFQVPKALPLTPQLVVETADGESSPVGLIHRANALGLFTSNGSGCGQAASLNYASDGTVSVNSPDNAASPGDWISLFGSGLGLVSPDDLNDGQAVPLGRLFGAINRGAARIGYEGYSNQVFADLGFWGRAPGLAGVDQFNIQIPVDAPEGCAVPFGVFASSPRGSSSQTVTLSIRKGGGRCQEPERATVGKMRWKRVARLGPKPGESATVESFHAEFVEGAENLLVNPSTERPIDFESYPLPGAACSGANPRAVAVGPLTVAAAVGGVTATLLPGPDNHYDWTPPSGTLSASTPTVSANASALISGFRSGVRLPAPVTFLDPPTPGTVISSTRPFVLRFTNAPGTLVSVKAFTRDLAGVVGDVYSSLAPVIGDLGVVQIPPASSVPPPGTIPSFRFPVPISDDVTIVVTFTPGGISGYEFSVPGLTKGGLHDWVYEYRFEGLKVR